MNDLEFKMLEILKDLKFKNQYLAVKADFEAEGTRIFELVNLCNILHKAKVLLAIKIGGCEAVLDLDFASGFKPNIVVAPMIETAFALRKFKAAKERIYKKKDESLDFCINIETKTAVFNIDEILKEAIGFISGIVIGRVDLSWSLNIKRDLIDSDYIFEKCILVAKKAKKAGLFVGVGGGFKPSSFSFLQNMADFIDRFETRKFIFNFCEDFELYKHNIIKATEFELLYLENKACYYKNLQEEDKKRIELLKERIGTIN